MVKHHYSQNVSSYESSMMMMQQQQKQHQQQLQNDTYSVPRSVSADDDEDDDGEKENMASKQFKKSSIMKVVSVENSNNSTVVVENYLLRYEHMVQQQEMEDKAIMAHLLPCIQRLIELINDQNDNSGSTKFYKVPQLPIQLHHEISYHQLYHAHQQIGRASCRERV